MIPKLMSYIDFSFAVRELQDLESFGDHLLRKTREILHFWLTLGQLGLSPMGPKMFAVLKNTKKLDILFIFVLSGK